MRDYAQGYSSKVHSPAAAHQHGGRVVAHPLRTLFWKTAGTMAVIAMCTGVLASFWIGHQIQNSLSSIAALEKASFHERDVQKNLVEERKSLLSTQRLLARAAVQNGLYQPTMKQKIGFSE